MLTANHAPYVTKELRKAIMKSLYLENLYFKKKKFTINQIVQKIKKNFCSKLYKKEADSQ